jgi:hypothetical protein
MVVAALLLLGTRADADVSKAECVKANAEAQKQRLDGRFGAAREKLESCADSSCPAMVREDCTRRLDEIERVQPTLVFEVKDASGSDVSAVKVTVDGQALTDRLVGKALDVDPGEHVFTFTVEGRSPVTRTFVVNEGEKDRRERIELAAPSPRVTSPRDAGSSPVESGGMAAPRILALSAGGAGVIGVSIGSAFGVLSTSAASRQQTDCASPTSCANHSQALSDHSTAASDGTIATAAFIAGGTLLAAGVTLFFTTGRTAETTSGRILIAPSVGPGTAAVSLSWGL